MVLGFHLAPLFAARRRFGAANREIQVTTWPLVEIVELRGRGSGHRFLVGGRVH